GRFQIKIKSADQKTADFVIEKDVRAGATATATAKQQQNHTRSKVGAGLSNRRTAAMASTRCA
ncbi:hypothetical protein, partial [Pseudomonas fluorescens]|uniref:hypothetical protein n=1 Tax=Pseudomonas fluorescens TaxID=294 RepID=UPI001A91FC13